MTHTNLLGQERVWILEMNSNPLKVEKSGNIHKFRGLCAEFSDELNENNRLYDKKNYDSKAKELLEKIEKNALLGELDHNEDFLVNLKHASHKITSLKDLGKSYEIEIQLIPGTTQGDNAIALANAGVPLFISSRASGFIDKAGNVTLEKIYTYDLVSEPGFKNAELVPVNESISYNSIRDGRVAVKQFKGKNIRIYKWTEPEHKGNTSNQNSKINNKNTGDMSYATKADVEALRNEIAKLSKNGLRTINESLQVPKKLVYNGIPVEMLNKIPSANDLLTIDSIEFTVKNVNNIDESKTDDPNFKLRGTYAYAMGLLGTDGQTRTGYITKTGELHIASEGIQATSSIKESIDSKTLRDAFKAMEKKTNQLVDTVNSILLEHNLSIKYIDSLSKLVETTVNEHNTMVKHVSLLGQHSDSSAKMINKIIESSDGFVKRLNVVAESLEATQQFSNLHAEHSDAQTTILNKLIEHTDQSIKHLNMLHTHADQLTGMVNVHESKISKGLVRTIPQAPVKRQAILENKGIKPVVTGKKDLLQTTKDILNKVKSNKTDETRAVLEAKFPFIKQFSELELSAFRKLSDTKKNLVLGKIGANARKANVMEAIRFAEKQDDQLDFLNLMPKEKKLEWAKLPTQRKQSIISLYQSKNLRTKTSIDAFWDNIDLKPVKTQGLVRRIDESVENKQLAKSAMGYSDDDMAMALGI